MMKLRCVSLEIVLFKSKEVRQQQKTGGGKKKERTQRLGLVSVASPLAGLHWQQREQQ